jgi:hypothetical protein
MTDNDITYWLRHFANAPSDSVLVGGDLLMEAADEIDRLRRLITEWADIEDNHGRPVLDDYAHWKLALEARVALRQAIGR